MYQPPPDESRRNYIKTLGQVFISGETMRSCNGINPSALRYVCMGRHTLGNGFYTETMKELGFWTCVFISHIICIRVLYNLCCGTNQLIGKHVDNTTKRNSVHHVEFGPGTMDFHRLLLRCLSQTRTTMTAVRNWNAALSEGV